MDWLTNRKVKVRGWHLCPNFVPNTLLDLLAATGGPHVHSLALLHLVPVEVGTTLLTVSQHCRNLTIVQLINCNAWSWPLSSMTMEARSLLKEVVVLNCASQWSFDFYRATFPTLERLRVLDMQESEHLHEALSGLLNASPRLRDLRINREAAVALFDCARLPSVRQRLAQLHTLVLCLYEVEFHSTTLGLLMRACRDLRNLHLRILEPWYKDEVVRGFVEHSTSITCLGLDGPFSGATVVHMAVHCGARLLYLSLYEAEFDDDAQLIIIGECCPSADSLVQLVTTLPHLTELILAECPVVTDAVLFAIAKHLPQLTSLGLFKSYGFTHRGAYALVRGLKQLRRFDPDHTVFTRLVLIMWQERIPALQTNLRLMTITHVAEQLPYP